MPELRLDPAPPPAVRRAPLPDEGRLLWTLRADYPPPHGTVYLRAARIGKYSDAVLDVLTPAGRLLQRAHKESFDQPPTALRADYLPQALQGHHGPFLRCKIETWQQFWAFPDGWAGLFSLSEKTEKDAKGTVWSGVTFSNREGLQAAGGADAIECNAPLPLPASSAGRLTRFAAVWFGSRTLLRWLRRGEHVVLEVLNPQGRVINRCRLPDTFGADQREGTLDGVWLNDKQRRGPTLVLRTSDQVRLILFPRGLTSAPITADFSDASSSISATTASIGRDKRGYLTVTESYSERSDEDGTPGNSHDTDYFWSGTGFSVSKPR